MNSLKDKLKNKKITVGSWITLSDPAIAEIMAKSDLDWIVVDMEHSALSVSQAQEIIRVINLAGIAPLVRVMENNPEAIKKFMDMGAHGVIVPRINTKLDAQKAVNAVKYPPNGNISSLAEYEFPNQPYIVGATQPASIASSNIKS